MRAASPMKTLQPLHKLDALLLTSLALMLFAGLWMIADALERLARRPPYYVTLVEHPGDGKSGA